MIATLQVPAPPVPPELPQVIIGGGPPEWIAPVIVVSLIAIVTGILLYPMARAWARRTEAGAIDAQLLDEVHHLRERVSDLESQVARVQELEERVDFTERLLSQRDEVARLPRDRGV